MPALQEQRLRSCESCQARRREQREGVSALPGDAAAAGRELLSGPRFTRASPAWEHRVSSEISCVLFYTNSLVCNCIVA